MRERDRHLHSWEPIALNAESEKQNDNSNIQPTHNKDDVEALDKCAPLARFMSFVPGIVGFNGETRCNGQLAKMDDAHLYIQDETCDH
jgi:hypothetical protein